MFFFINLLNTNFVDSKTFFLKKESFTLSTTFYSEKTSKLSFDYSSMGSKNFQKKIRKQSNFFMSGSPSEETQKKGVDLTGDGGVIKTITQKGGGTDIKNGNFVKVHYKGRLENGEIFDSSLERKEPYSFKLGEGKVIKGWEIGIQSMKIGEKANFSISSNYGYKKKGIPPIIPPNAKLFFEIELLDATGESQQTEGFYDKKSLVPRTAREISEEFEKKMQNKTPKENNFANFFFISPFRSQTGDKAPWWLNPNITFVLAAAFLLLAFYAVVSIGGIHQGYVDQDFDANLLKKR